MPPLCYSRGEGGSGGVGDGHPDYTSSCGLFPLDTKQDGVLRRSHTNGAHGGCQALWFHRVISRTVTCSAGRSCDPVVRTNRVAQFVLGRAKGRGRKKYFPSAIFNLPALKVVVICGLLRCAKVKGFYFISTLSDWCASCYLTECSEFKYSPYF